LEQAALLAHPDQALAASLWSLMGVEGHQARDLGLALLEAQNWAWAEYFFSQQLAQTPDDSLSYAYRGIARDQAGGEGRADIENAIALAPQSPLPYYALGLSYRLEGRYDFSQQAFLDAHLLDPQNPALVAELAASFAWLDQYEQADFWYTEATTLAPGDERFIALRAAFYADQAYELAGGDDFVQASLANDPQNPSLLASWGRLRFHRGDLAGSREALELALAAQPEDWRAQFYYAEPLERLRLPNEARPYYFRVAQSKSHYAEGARIALQRLAE
jgi:Flp pilus assembly protein TadD